METRAAQLKDEYDVVKYTKRIQQAWRLYALRKHALTVKKSGRLQLAWQSLIQLRNMTMDGEILFILFDQWNKLSRTRELRQDIKTRGKGLISTM